MAFNFDVDRISNRTRHVTDIHLRLLDMMPHGGFRFAGIARLQRSKNSAMLRQRLFGTTGMGA
jgi:hypothetical protein